MLHSYLKKKQYWGLGQWADSIFWAEPWAENPFISSVKARQCISTGEKLWIKLENHFAFMKLKPTLGQVPQMENMSFVK